MLKYKIVEEEEDRFYVWYKLPFKPWMKYDITYSSAYNAESFGLASLRKYLQYPKIIRRGYVEI